MGEESPCRLHADEGMGRTVKFETTRTDGGCTHARTCEVVLMMLMSPATMIF